MRVRHRIHMKSTWNKCYIIPSNKELFIYRLILINDGEETSSIDRIIYLYAGNVADRSKIRREFVVPHKLLPFVVSYSRLHDQCSSKWMLFHIWLKRCVYKQLYHSCIHFWTISSKTPIKSNVQRKLFQNFVSLPVEHSLNFFFHSNRLALELRIEITGSSNDRKSQKHTLDKIVQKRRTC